MRKILKIHKELFSIIVGFVLSFIAFWTVIYLINYFNTGIFDLKELIVGIVIFGVIGYVLLFVIIAFLLIFSTTPLKIKLVFKKPIMTKIPILLLIVIITISALKYDHSLFDKEDLSNIINFAWIIHGLNITVFIFSFAFITNRLEKEINKDNNQNASHLLTKTNYNYRIHSRYGTFTFIFVTSLFLIISTFSVIMKVGTETITKSNFITIIISFSLSTNTLLLVLNDVMREISDIKGELLFNQNLIKEEVDNALVVLGKTRMLNKIIKDSKTSIEIVDVDDLKKIIEKYKDSDLSKVEDEKTIEKFSKLALDFVEYSVKYLKLFNYLNELLGKLDEDNLEVLFEIKKTQKKIIKSRKKYKKNIKKLSKFNLK